MQSRQSKTTAAGIFWTAMSSTKSTRPARMQSSSGACFSVWSGKLGWTCPTQKHDHHDQGDDMPRRHSKVKRRSQDTGFSKYQIDFLLDGRMWSRDELLAAGENGFAALAFHFDSVPQHARNNGAISWRDCWAAIQDSDLVRQWREDNPGRKTHAERMLQK